VFLVIITIRLTAFSQTGTNNETKCFPLPVAKQIAKDLLRGDSALAQLKLTENLLFETEMKIQMKDNIISTMTQKEKNYIKIIDTEREKFGILDSYTKGIEMDLKKEKIRSRISSYTSLSIMAILSVIILTN
jgi:hypothetical protein